MFRPERMSKVSVTGPRSVMGAVVEAVHDLDVLHLSEYRDEFEGFESGDPMDGAESASEKLVTVRSLESILDVTGEDAGPARIVDEAALEENLETVRTAVNELDDRRGELRDELRTVEDAIETAQPLVELGIDLDLLSGYDSLGVAVGEGDPDAVEGALADDDAVDAFELFAGEDAVAAFAHPTGSLEDALVGVEFARIEVPDPGDRPAEPAAYVEDLESERGRLESELETVENELEDLRLEHAGFLLAAEERLSIEVQKAEAPLSFATTERAFVAEGWLPSGEFETFAARVREAVGDAVEIEEVERADYASGGHEGHEEAATDGGTTIADDGPPVVQNNPRRAKPFEAFVEAVGVPRYGELDPTVILFVTFPLFFGFMIGDVGYGLLYIGIGYWMLRRFDSALASMGAVGMWCGVFTAVFGVLYGELFGLHLISGVIPGGGLLHKGLQPKYIDWALMWLLFAVFAGIVHLVIGWVFDFVNNYRAHGITDAVAESGSWILMAFGLWSWVFSSHLPGPKPEFIFSTPLWSSALVPAEVGIAGLGVFLLGGIIVTAAEGGVGFLEAFLSVSAFGTILSYTRIAAVLVAKAGMALGVNLLVFGAYQSDDGAFHYIFLEGGTHGYEAIFSGMVNGEGTMLLVGGVAGLLVFLVGHAIVLALGLTSAGLQAVRLEYVEFFGEFYEGGGEEYEPFGYERVYTAED